MKKDEDRPLGNIFALNLISKGQRHLKCELRQHPSQPDSFTPAALRRDHARPP